MNSDEYFITYAGAALLNVSLIFSGITLCASVEKYRTTAPQRYRDTEKRPLTRRN